MSDGPDISHEIRRWALEIKRRVENSGANVIPRGFSAGPAPRAPLAPPLPATIGTAPSNEARLKDLRERIGDCQLCPLGATRIKLVFGVGNPNARVMFIGEGPGFSEDRQGEPFVGPAGQLLDKILSSVDLSRQRKDPLWKWVYIANMVKCHPMIEPAQPDKRGNDRPPVEEEMAACSPFLMEQIRIIRPRFIVALGATAGKALLQTSRGISSFRGQWSGFSLPEGEIPEIKLLPTYHPAALLRNPALKKDVWEDMKKLRAELERSEVS